MLFKVDPDPDPGKEIEVDPDPDPDPRRGSKWIRIRIRPNVVDPGGSGSGSGSATLISRLLHILHHGRCSTFHKFQLQCSMFPLMRGSRDDQLGHHQCVLDS